MSKIITVTVNTSIDYLIEVSDFEIGAATRALSGERFAGGGGINVARALATLGEEVISLGFVGADSATFFEEPELETHCSLLTVVTEKNRENITVHDPERHVHSYIQTPGYSVTLDDLHRLNKTMQQFISPDDWVVISGSLPAGAPKSTEWELVRLAQSLGATVVLDTSKEDLKRGLDAKPYMVKPDLHHGRCLDVEYFVVEGVYSPREIAEALMVGVEEEARRHDCRAIHAKIQPGPNWMSDMLKDRHYESETSVWCKPSV